MQPVTDAAAFVRLDFCGIFLCAGGVMGLAEEEAQQDSQCQADAIDI